MFSREGFKIDGPYVVKLLVVLGLNGVWDCLTRTQERYILVFGEWVFYTAHPILINGHPRTLNIGSGWDVSWQKKQEIKFFESFAHKNSKLIEKIDIYDSYPPLPFFGLAHSIFYDDFKSKYLYPLLKDEMNLPF